MSILVEIAEKAHVSVEGVLRVLTREPVSDAIKERVLAVLDDLDPEQNRILQRFALAALHDALPRPGEMEEEVDEVGLALLPSGAEPAPQLPVAAPDTAHLVQLSSVLEELAGAVRDLRQETDVERRERVDDLAVLIELISTGWQGLDRRLGRLERQLGRLETPRPQLPVHATPAAAAPPPPPAAPPPVVERPTPEPSARPKRDRLPLAAAIALVGLVAGTLAVLQLVAGEPAVDGVSSRGSDFLETVADVPATTETATTTAATTTAAPTTAATTTAATTTAPTRTAAPPPVRRPAPPTTSAVLGTATTVPAPPPARTQTTGPSATTTAPRVAESSGFRPTRDWAWAPVDGADYYSVQFLRGGTGLYRTWTENTRIRLPDSVVFRPGSYRWVVRPGFGERSAGRLGPPVVDSSFTVQ